MVASAGQIYTNLVGMMGPGNPSGLSERRAARRQMIQELEPLLPSYGIPHGGHRLSNGRIDRRSVYAGPTTPMLYHKLESGFRTDENPERTRRAVRGYHRGLTRVETFYPDLSFVTVVISREHHAGLRGGNRGMVPNTFVFGGLDHLGGEMSRMHFIPAEITRRWTDLGEDVGCEGPGNTRCHVIRAASIPSNHELIAYAGVLRLRETAFRERLQSTFSNRGASLLSSMTTPQRRAWTQLAFGRQNGLEYRPAAGDAQFASDDSGLITILTAGRHYEQALARPFSLQSIFEEQSFARMASVRIARARAVEAAVVDRYGLLTTGYQGSRGAGGGNAASGQQPNPAGP
ncbi:MAG: hypothetical protein ACOC1U_04940 [Spirochaetota bacterium]